jgi:hypothetical protein
MLDMLILKASYLDEQRFQIDQQPLIAILNYIELT